MQPKANFLTRNQKDILRARHRHERDKRLCDRIKTILLLDQGWTYEAIAEILLLDDDTIKRYYKTYSEGGKEALLNFNYTGKACQLSHNQLEELKIYVKEEVPSSAKQVINFAKNHFGASYTPSAMVSLLHRLNFTYKKPKLIPGKVNEEAKEIFSQELQKLEKELAQTDQLLYLDGVHPQHNSKPSYGWYEKGSKAVLLTNTGRKRININGALDVKDLEVTTVSSDSINAQSTIELFKKLEEKYPLAQRIVAVCDNAAYYRSKMVADYLKTSRVEIKFLPPYSPDLNLIERLWRFMNKKVRNNRYYEKFLDFKTAICTFFENIPKHREELQPLLSRKFAYVKT
jgi:transposase